ncbi:MAG: serpin family protein [Clostridia bacterium]|nr:serpin family protein [Clostridia bacterium]
MFVTMVLLLSGCVAEGSDTTQTTTQTTTTVATTAVTTTAATTVPTTLEPASTTTATVTTMTAATTKTTKQQPTTTKPQPKDTALDLMSGINVSSAVGRPTDEAFIESQMEMSLKLFAATAEASKGKNALISPLSIQLALAMAANGAGGETKAQLEALLGGDIPLKQLNEYLYTYIKRLIASDESALKLANSIWLRNDKALTVEKEFLASNAKYYDAQAYKAAFDDTTVKSINDWVSKNTDGMIDSILNDIPPYAMLYLLNAVSFEAPWDTPWKKEWVKDGQFTTYSGDERAVKTLDKKNDYGYYYDDGKALGFSYSLQGDDGVWYDFVALLPNEGTDVYDYVAGLTAEEYLQAMSHFKKADRLITKLPTFKYEYEKNMNDILSDLGVRDMFDASKADLSKMGRYGDLGLVVNDVLHKTVIDVTPGGVKAAAVTSIMPGDGAPMPPANPKIVEIILDRPFVYMIVDRKTDLPVFMGVVTDIGE